MKLRVLPLLIFVALLTSHAAAGTRQHVEPWEWSLDERIPMRIQALQLSTAGADSSPRRFEIHGYETPELLMPGELFNALLNGLSSDADIRETYRTMFRRRLADDGIDEDRFWQRLSTVAAPYVSLLAQRNFASDTTDEHFESRLCLARAAALAAARRDFANENFNRLLYTVVAPVISISSSATPNERDLRRMEGGCR